MPETTAAVGTFFEGLGGAATVGEAGTVAEGTIAADGFAGEAGLAGLGGGAEVGAGGYAGGIGAGFSSADAAGSALGSAGFDPATGAALEEGGAGGTDLATSAPAYGGPGTPGAGAAGEGAPGFSLSSLFANNGPLASAFSKGGTGLGAIQVLSSLYGLDQSKKLQKQSAGPGITAAGLQAVQRSQAAGGYLGSGNILTALQKYGMETATPNIAGTQAGITGQLSSLGLLTAGLPKLFGWGDSGAGVGATGGGG